MSILGEHVMDGLICPQSRQPLSVSPDGTYLYALDNRYPIMDNVPCINNQNAFSGEFNVEEMDQLLGILEEEGVQKVSEYVAANHRAMSAELITNPDRGRFADILHLQGDETVLDIGCGLGANSIQFAGKVGKVYGLDAVHSRVRFLETWARKEGIENIQTVCSGDILKLPFKDEYFDVIMLVGCLEYLPASLPDQPTDKAFEMIMAEILRVLKVGGRLYVGTKNRYGWHFLSGMADHNRIRFGPVLPRWLANGVTKLLYRRPYRIVVDSLAGYRRLFVSSGLEKIEAYWPWPSYQQPIHMTELSEGDLILDKLESVVTTWSAPKRIILKGLDRVGLLRYIVPYFSFVACKRR